MAPRRVIALVTALAASAALAAPAQATFPGRNGDIYWTEALPGDTLAFVLLRELDPVTGQDRNVWGCGLGVFPDVPCNDGTSVAASPDGQIAFISALRRDNEYTPTLRLFNRDGSQRDVALPPSPAYDTDRDGRRLSFLDDGVTLAAQTYGGAFTAPYLYRRLGVDGTVGGQIGPVDAQWLDWSIDGRAAFAYLGNVYVLDRHGRQRQLTFGGGDAPSWSPRAKQIAFVRDHDIYVVGSHGGKARRLTSNGADWPVWSPDGTKIAFVRSASVWVLDLETGQEKKVLTPEFPSYDRYYATPPVWQALPR